MGTVVTWGRESNTEIMLTREEGLGSFVLGQTEVKSPFLETLREMSMTSGKLVPAFQLQCKGHAVNDPCYKERKKAEPCSAEGIGFMESASEDVTLHMVQERKRLLSFHNHFLLSSYIKFYDESTKVEGTGREEGLQFLNNS